MRWPFIRAGVWCPLLLLAAVAVQPAASSAGLPPRVAAGSVHGLFLSPGGVVWAWGSNQDGQLGQIGVEHRITPVPVSISNVVQIAAGGHHSLAVKQDGSLWAWGRNTSGQLGDGKTISTSTPVQVRMRPQAFAKIAAGDAHTLVMDPGGFITSWGAGARAPFAPAASYSAYPTFVSLKFQAADIAAGAAHSVVAEASEGLVYAWGDNSHGQLGDGTTEEPEELLPVPGLSGVTRVAAGETHTLALKSDGTVWAWGGNGSGQLGDGTLHARHSPVQVEGLTDVIDIAACGHHSLALTSDASVWTWGTNEYGELGQSGIGSLSAHPVQVPAFGARTGLAAGEHFCLTMFRNGQPYAWGRNNVGQIGAGTVQERHDPTPVGVYNGLQAVSIGAGLGFSLALLRDGLVRSWGVNNSGQLSNGTSSGQNRPGLLLGPTNAVQVAGGDSYSLVLSATDGSVWGAGASTFGQMMLTAPPYYLETAQRLPGLTNVSQIAAGKWHALALKKDRTVWSWGANYYGELGDGTTGVTNPSARQVSNLTDVIQVAAGDSHSLALKGDGTVWAWGYNRGGQLGDGTTLDKLVPVQVRGLTGVTSIAAGGSHNLARKSDGTVWVWGGNYYFQLGDGNRLDVTLPQQVLGLSRIEVIGAGWISSFAADSDGNVWAWGNNDRGQLGDGTTDTRSRPEKLAFFGKVTRIAAGRWHTLATISDASVWAWGDNSSGQIGDGTNAEHRQPTETWGSN